MKKFILCILLISLKAFSLMPYEIIVLANNQSQDSLKVANHFVQMRNIPLRNLIYVDVPQKTYNGTASCTPEEFTEYIWNPVNQVITARGLEDQVLAWVYSVDFPIRVITDTIDSRQMSICGYTFLRNESIQLSLVENGNYLSKLFLGPNKEIPFYLPSRSLSYFKHNYFTNNNEVVKDFPKIQSQDEMPLPSMMLGYIGENGNTVDTVLKTLQIGKRSDFLGQKEGIWFFTNNNVRSTCRSWQYPGIQERLTARGISSEITNEMPNNNSNIMGVLCGKEWINTKSIGSFAPGAVAEHLTSWSAEFQRPQTKCTSWIEAGATATSGSVVEPYSNPNKFISARFFEHYIAGCSILESFYQSIASPLQQLFLGEPLARPYSPYINVDILGPSRLTRSCNYMVSAQNPFKNKNIEYTYLIDGKISKISSNDYNYFVDINDLSDGYHELTVFVNIDNLVKFYGMETINFSVDRFGRSIDITENLITKIGSKYILKPIIKGKTKPNKIRIVYGEMSLDEKNYGENTELTFDQQDVGEGPCHIQIQTIYDDNMLVSSAPLYLNVIYSD